MALALAFHRLPTPYNVHGTRGQMGSTVSKIRRWNLADSPVLESG